MSQTCRLTVWGITLDIEYDVVSSGFRGSREEPPEPMEIDIVEVGIGGELTEERHLASDFTDAIEAAVYEYESNRSYDGDDYHDVDFDSD